MTIMMYKDQLLEVLSRCIAYDDLEHEHIIHTISFLNSCPNPFSSIHSKDHITASAIVIDQAESFIMLVWHDKLQLWLQPGGHCEDIDPTTHDTALRELVEETGVFRSLVSLCSEKPFDIDVHLIPSKPQSHIHFDLRYLYKVVPNFTLSNDLFFWRSFDDLVQMPSTSMKRIAGKLISRKGGK